MLQGLLGDKGNMREYSLDRLGVPLVEIALEPVEGKPEENEKDCIIFR